MLADPKRDVTPIKKDLKLSKLKVIHAKTVSKVYVHLKSDKGRQVIHIERISTVSITEAVMKIWENPKSRLNPC